MCKLCGFADHGHIVAPCPKCHVPQSELFSDKSLQDGIPFTSCVLSIFVDVSISGYPARDGERHRQLCYQYAALKTTKAREEFFKRHGVRWTEFARLKYFDLIRYTVIDPMHNLLLGVAKTQWYTQWIQTKTLRADTGLYHRELSFIHKFLASYEAPQWAGHLPLRVGEPAGGSLSADEYKFAVTGPWAIIVSPLNSRTLIPIVWERFLEEANQDYAKAKQNYNKIGRAKGESKPFPRMVEGEDENFLRFATALKIIVGRSIRLEKLPRIKSLLHKYLTTFSEIYGSSEMKPNHHWAVHVPDQLVDFGPVYNFWAFFTERLNKLLKNINSNNWTGGELEVSMMREFHRNGAVDSAVSPMIYLNCSNKYSQACRSYIKFFLRAKDHAHLSWKQNLFSSWLKEIPTQQCLERFRTLPNTVVCGIRIA
ncbi:hypothetical protein C8F04DRAFT_939036 [Mycena alexandri]|uniref:Uncharacterized protein n=1 Tax=Mycena alexandri TaxID=1745969 RepID=A0AAD6XDJ0_9AGAR|nr:hypothetical protein C8F04DRAFT_939036 [Mycena alexandri]